MLLISFINLNKISTLMGKILTRLVHEMKNHAPFTIFGALTGIAIMIIIIYGNFLDYVSPISEDVFYILHPTHVFFSAIVTTTLFIKYNKKNLWLALIIGYTGSVGIATISDSVIPFLGETILGLDNPEAHIGFIEAPLRTNIPAIIGILLGYWRGVTKLPHAGHVLISTWASLFHIITAIGSTITFLQMIGIFVFLFLAVWIPCCTSDIAYPVLFSMKSKDGKVKSAK
jgi:hypothetical protein